MKVFFSSATAGQDRGDDGGWCGGDGTGWWDMVVPGIM